MIRNWRGRSSEAAGAPLGAGLKLMVLAASTSLMLLGFGAVAASPASADGGFDGTYTPLCADGYHFDSDTSKCVKPDLVEQTGPNVSYVGTCDVVRDTEATGEGVDAEAQPIYGPWVFDTTNGMCTRTKISGSGPSTQTKPGNITETIRTCDEGWTLMDKNGPVDDASQQPKYWCERTTTFEPQDPTCKSGDTLVPAPVGTSDKEQKGARCYTPKRYCEFTGGQWIRTPKAEGNNENGDWYNGYCFHESTGIFCQASLDGTSFVTATYYLKYGVDPGPPNAAMNHDAFYTYPSVFAEADIVPVIANPIDAENPVNPGQNLGDGGQAFLDRGCVPPPPVPTVAGGGPAPTIDYCPNLAGVQWENYDCNTGATPVPVVEAATVAAVPVNVPAPAVVATPVQKPAKVTVPEAATVPSAVPSGGGSSAPSGAPLWAIALMVIGALGAAGAGLRLAGARTE